MEWSNDESLRLIDEYKKRPILWDVKHRLHYSKQQKSQAWTAIGENLNVSAADAKQKMNSLLGSLRREKSKILKAAAPGQGKYKSENCFLEISE